jgi:hypothetical protein
MTTRSNIGECQRCRAVAELTHVITSESMLAMIVCWRCMTEATQFSTLTIVPIEEYENGPSKS